MKNTGARPLRRAIQNRIEDPLAEEILAGHVKGGDTVAAGMAKGAVKFLCPALMIFCGFLTNLWYNKEKSNHRQKWED